MMRMNNRLREDDSKHIIWPLLEVNHLIFDVGEVEKKPVVIGYLCCIMPFTFSI